MAKKVMVDKKAGKRAEKAYAEPKRLSKTGEWMRAHPKGLGLEILDWRAVMR